MAATELRMLCLIVLLIKSQLNGLTAVIHAVQPFSSATHVQDSKAVARRSACRSRCRANSVSQCCFMHSLICMQI